MNFQELLESAEIFVRNGFGDDFISAEHDMIFGPGISEKLETMPAEDMARLEELGWSKDREYDCMTTFV
jgi:hypothetical protein